jgi:hypothetical protein
VRPYRGREKKKKKKKRRKEEGEFQKSQQFQKSGGSA